MTSQVIPPTQGPAVIPIITTIFGSFLVSIFTVETFFYHITNHIGLWMIFLSQFIVLIMMLIGFYNYLYHERYWRDQWWQSRQALFVFMLMTFFLILILMLKDLVLFEIETSPLPLMGYVNLFMIAIFVIFGLFTKIQGILG